MRFGIPAILREIKFTLDSWRGNFWFLPAIIGFSSLILFAVTIWLDQNISLGFTAIRELPFWFSGGPEASRSLLSTIGSAIGTITTVVFSISILTLQLASTEYTPRLLRSFTRSAISQITLGTFVATVAYSILVLGTVRDESPAQEAFVPDVSINIAKLLALTSLGFLIYFIGHIAVLISPSHIIATSRNDTLDAYRSFIQDKVGEDAPPVPAQREEIIHTVAAKKNGYIRRIRISKILIIAGELVSEAKENNAGIAAKAAIGDYVKEGDTLAELITEHTVSEGIFEEIKQAFVIGETRLPESDFRYGIDELYSITLRRINQRDPSTAMEAVRALTEVWLKMMEEPLYPPDRWIKVRHEQLHLALMPVDTDQQLVDSMRGIQVHSLGEVILLDVASAVNEGLSTVARESACRGFRTTFDKAWPCLVWSTIELVKSTDDKEILHRVVRSLLPVKAALSETYPEKWNELSAEISGLALAEEKAGTLNDLWRD